MTLPGVTSSSIQSANPVTGNVERAFEALSAGELEGRLERTARASVLYQRTTFLERKAWMLRTADLLEDRVDHLALLVTTEMGKTLTSARAEVFKCAAGARYYAENAERFMLDEPVAASKVGARQAFVRWQPLGAILAVMPWNYPYWQVVRFAAPALMSGNVALLKHASNVPQCALALEALFIDAGFPVDVFQTLLIEAATVATVVRDPRVAAVTVTGSERAGQSIATDAASVIKKVVLELGGSDPFVVLPSADIKAAAKAATAARFQNAGQSCISAKRFIVHRQCADEFIGAFTRAARTLVAGDPLDPSTDMGPLATERGRSEIEELVANAMDLGADLLLGGHRIDGPGWFYQATILGNITPEMRLFSEEAFGPVATISVVDSLEDAVRLANSTGFGLGANVWTRDNAEQTFAINELQAGAVFINGMTTSYPELPFGGIKRSGYGRELAAFGLREFCNAKTVWIG